MPVTAQLRGLPNADSSRIEVQIAVFTLSSAFSSEGVAVVDLAAVWINVRPSTYVNRRWS